MPEINKLPGLPFTHTAEYLETIQLAIVRRLYGSVRQDWPTLSPEVKTELVDLCNLVHQNRVQELVDNLDVATLGPLPMDTERGIWFGVDYASEISNGPNTESNYGSGPAIDALELFRQEILGDNSQEESKPTSELNVFFF